MKKRLLLLLLLPLSMNVNAESGENCSKLENKDQRLECYDSIFMKKETKDTEQEQAKDNNEETRWSYKEDKDDMRGVTNYFAKIWSKNEVNFSFPYQGGSKAGLMLRKHSEYGNDIIITIDKGQFNSCFNGCSMAVKFDDNKVEKYQLSGSDSGLGSALFISSSKNIKKFAEKLKKSKKMIVELHFFNHGKEQFTFDVSNLEWKHF